MTCDLFHSLSVYSNAKIFIGSHPLLLFLLFYELDSHESPRGKWGLRSSEGELSGTARRQKFT